MIVRACTGLVVGASILAGSVRPAAAKEPPNPEDSSPALELRKRKLCRATIGLGGIAAGSLIVAGGLLGGYNRTGDDALAIADGFAWTTLGAAALAMIGTGIGCGLTTSEQRRLLAGDEVWPEGNPRLDPNWRLRDRSLRAGTIAFSTLLGIGVFGLVLTFALVRTSGNTEDGTPAGISYATFASVAGLSVVPAIGYGVAWHHHRTPLRISRPMLSAGGLVLHF
jgi:hypothetical protein